MRTLQEDITDLREALDRAERLYVNLACSHERAVLNVCEEHLRPGDSLRDTWIREQTEKLRAAEKQAREVFYGVVHGEIEP